MFAPKSITHPIQTSSEESFVTLVAPLALIALIALLASKLALMPIYKFSPILYYLCALPLWPIKYTTPSYISHIWIIFNVAPIALSSLMALLALIAPIAGVALQTLKSPNWALKTYCQVKCQGRVTRHGGITIIARRPLALKWAPWHEILPKTKTGLQYYVVHSHTFPKS